MPTGTSLRAIPPSYVPTGYKLRRKAEGSQAGGFGEEPTQVALIYTRGWEQGDFTSALAIYVTQSTKAVLFATEKHPGLPLDFGASSVRAVYHDGLWAPGPGEIEQHLGDVTIHWVRSVAHSITIYSPNGTYAVRGPKETIGFDELLRIAKSLNLGG